MIIYSVPFIILSLILTKLYCFTAQGTRLMDKPNERSLHVVPTVRGAGIVFIFLFLSALLFFAYLLDYSWKNWLPLFGGAILISGVSFCDDLFHLSAKTRFGVQCVVAGFVLVVTCPSVLDFLFFPVAMPYLIVPLLFFIMLWAINHFNFMDGLDGFCGAQGLFLFLAYGFLFGQQEAVFYQYLCYVMVLGLVGFLLFNLPPAKVFMGDVGSATLGFISFYMALAGQKYYQIPIGYWFILNSLFLFDATLTLLRRILNHEKWFAPHKKHAYQRLKQYGFSTYVILLGQLLINSLLFIGLYLIHCHLLNNFVVLIFMMVLLLGVYLFAEKYYPMFPKKLLSSK